VIHLSQLTIESGPFRLRGVDFRVEVGEYVTLMGSTGCGKTTLLEAISGLRPVTSGRIVLGGVEVTRARPSERGIGYVPQDGALFRTRTVARHLSFALEIRGWPKADIRERVTELAHALDVTQLLDRLPAGLSGGERQRVALGRALSFRPPVLLLDEPLSALDDRARSQLRSLLLEVTRAEDVTVVHVTHHRDEAESLGTRVVQFTDLTSGSRTRGADK